jgi:3-oxoisoapionate decarboxylase
VDVGNNFTLLEEPLEVVRSFTPWAFTVHLKDQAVHEYAEGFLYGDAALGRGFLPIEEMVRLLRQARPDVTFNLEVITRDPLKVPVLTPGFWATLPDVPARDLARTLQIVKAKAAPAPLTTVTTLPLEEQLALEQNNIEQSLTYARERL